MTTTHNLTGRWHGITIQQVGDSVIASADAPNPHFNSWNGTLNGDILTMRFSGGGSDGAVYIGNVAADGRSISWNNDTIWTKG
jgi:hypothetical protein